MAAAVVSSLEAAVHGFVATRFELDVVEGGGDGAVMGAGRELVPGAEKLVRLVLLRRLEGASELHGLHPRRERREDWVRDGQLHSLGGFTLFLYPRRRRDV